ncbi:MAG: heparinase II/III family protein [Candidatus Marinimicrobia bacterium]|nr:heparinase II/III family protein [Candidatus Neomarinimicrobiota bacterium]
MVKKFLHLLVFQIIIPCTFLLSQTLPPVKPTHPRLFIDSSTLQYIKGLVRNSEQYGFLHRQIIGHCDTMLDYPVVEEKLIGKRMLAASRSCLRTVVYHSYGFLMTGEQKYFKKARDEMLAAAAFQSWNPSHFLDVGEMSLALAIGYDWLYDELSDADKEVIVKALWEKGMSQALDPTQNHWWIKGDNNWNPVCHAGMAAASIAVFEHYPQESDSLIRSAIRHLPVPMKHYNPNGNYPEGGMYWSYGTTFNGLLIDALESAFSQDFGLFDQPGFAETPLFYLNIVTPTGRFFNYSDCDEYPEISPGMCYFAKKLKNPALLYNEMKIIQQYQAGKKSFSQSYSHRLLPFVMVWGIEGDTGQGPAGNSFTGQGINPVAMWRSSWTDSSLFLGIKAGSPSVSHGHMDVGSFVLEKHGVRWALDLGKQDYHTLETIGLNIWDAKQRGDRWKVFRYNNLSHNTLVIDDSLQQVEGFATIEIYENTDKSFRAGIDLTTLYSVEKAERFFKISNNETLTITDRIKTKERKALGWGFVTDATILIQNFGKQARLEKSGRILEIFLVKPSDAEFVILTTSPPPENFDADNPGTQRLGIEIFEQGQIEIEVKFR